MSNPAFAAIILAAGEGTRLNSALPKVLHQLAGWPLIRHVTEALRPLAPAEAVVVIGQGMEAVARAAAPARTAIQSPPRGTGDAVRAAKSALEPRLAKGDIADVVGIARAQGLACRVAELPAEELIGVNTRAELAEAEAILQQRLRRRAIENGASLIAPDTVFLSADTKLGRDVVVEPNVVFGPGVTVADNVRIRSFSHLDGATIAAGAIVGPFARLRPGAVLEQDVHVGNFVEVKATRLGAGAKANHLSYLGDSEIGAGTNIGAGTITCNYDGFNKHRTVIGENAFIGSNTAFVAPVTVGDGAYVATGSVVTEDVPKDALTIARARQANKPGRGAELKAKLRGKNR